MTHRPRGGFPRPTARQIHRGHRPAFSNLLSDTRLRLRAALLATVAVAVFLTFVVFPAQRLHVEADGSELMVVSRHQDIVSLLESAGIKRGFGDVLVLDPDQRQIVLDRATPVLVQVDGRSIWWRSRADTVVDLLGELEVTVGEHDVIVLNGVPAALDAGLEPGLEMLAATLSAGGILEAEARTPGVSVVIERAIAVTLRDGGETAVFHTTLETLEALLLHAGIELESMDLIQPPPETPLSDGLEVEIRRARTVTLHMGDATTVLQTHAPTLRGALEEAGFHLDSEARVEPDIESAVFDGLEARIVRVLGVSVYEREEVPHVIAFRPDASLSGAETRRVEGTMGVRVTEYRVVIEDGVELETVLVDSFFDPEPVDTVIYYAAEAVHELGFSVEDLRVAEVMHMFATWYNAASSGKPADHPGYGITYSGLPLAKGIVAVDPAVIPLGTRMFIPGYGFAVAADTGGGIIGNMIDLGYPDGMEVDWHTGWTDVYILAP